MEFQEKCARFYLFRKKVFTQNALSAVIIMWKLEIFRFYGSSGPNR